MSIPTVSRYMTPHPHAVAPRTRLSLARDLMDAHKIRHLPVIDHEKLVGILSDHDLRAFHAPEDNVADAMTEEVATVVEATPLAEVVTLMETKQLSSVVIVGDASVEGIFTRTDAMRAFCDLLQRDEASQR
jgi:CBS domain-containing protein